jgi:hypothetical protein
MISETLTLRRDILRNMRILLLRIHVLEDRKEVFRRYATSSRMAMPMFLGPVVTSSGRSLLTCLKSTPVTLSMFQFRKDPIMGKCRGVKKAVCSLYIAAV